MLSAALATAPPDGPVSEAHWPGGVSISSQNNSSCQLLMCSGCDIVVDCRNACARNATVTSTKTRDGQYVNAVNVNAPHVHVPNPVNVTPSFTYHKLSNPDEDSSPSQ